MDLSDAKRAGYYNIGEAAARSGVTAKMIRHYEAMGLVKQPRRTVAGYRVYVDADVHTLRFIRRARALGFAMDEIQQLLGLWQNRRRSNSDVRSLAEAHLAALDRKILELQEMRAALQDLVKRCHADGRPDCPILDDLATAEE